MAKKFMFKNKTDEELKSMSLEDFGKLLPSRQRRSLKRGLTDQQKIFMKRLRKTTKALKTHCRNMIVIPEMIGKRILIHSGKEWVSVDITAELMGRRLGEFALTRKKVQHSSPGVGASRSSKFTPLK